MFIVASIFVSTGGTLSPRTVFTTLSLVGVMRTSIMFACADGGHHYMVVLRAIFS